MLEEPLPCGDVAGDYADESLLVADLNSNNHRKEHTEDVVL